MKAIRIRRALLAMVVFLGLSSCSLAYKVDIVVRNGTIIFVPYELGFFGGREKDPAKVESISVQKVSKELQTVWEIQSTDMNGTELPHVAYGTLPVGFQQKTAPEKLEIGQLYVIWLRALGGGGDQYFVMSPYSYLDDPEVEFIVPSD